jgi:16S rRNA processing protein RimM
LLLQQPEVRPEDVSMTTAPVPTGTIDPAWPEDAVEIGRILDAWGVKGWLRVQPFASDPQALFSSRRWFVKPPEPQGIKLPATAAAAFPPFLKVVQVKEHGDGVVAQVADVADRTGAEALRGARLFVSRASFPTAEKDEYYWVDLIGMTVVNREGQTLGTVAGLIDTGPHSVLRLAAPTPAEERLIPFVGAYVDDVSMAERRITVDWGLDY